jgi:amino acid transporter
MFYGWQIIALSYIIFIILAWGAYPGASMEFATIIATATGIPIGLCYALLATVYPRSGGDYVFVSRIIHPVVGFATSFSFTFWQWFYLGINGALLALFAISPFFAALGVQTSNSTLLDISTWFSSKWGIFITGSVMIAVMALLQYRGAGVYFRWQRRAAYISLASLLITLVVLVLAAAGVLDFKANFDEVAGAGAYARVTSGTTVPGFDFGQTLAYMLWPAFAVWFAIAAVSFSGEVKNVQRGQLWGINGAIFTMGLATLLLMLLSRLAFGSGFLLSSSASANYELAAPPFINVFTAIAGGNVLLSVLTFAWVLLIAFFVGGAALMYATRSMLAWSIDGVAPKRLSEVSDRYHSPHWAILISAFLAEIFLALYAFTGLLGPIAGFFGLSLSLVVAVIAAIIFPFRKREVFENSPVAWRLGSIPAITVIGLIAIIPVVYVAWRLLVDSTYTPNLLVANIGGLAVIAVGVVLFYVARAYTKSRGVDIDRRYREIPVE